MLQIEKKGNWQMYWGSARLPQGAEALGTVKDGKGRKGALIKLLSGVYVRGNASGICSLPQTEVEQVLARSAAAAALRAIPSEVRSAASRANGARGGRPKGSGKKGASHVIA